MKLSVLTFSFFLWFSFLAKAGEIHVFEDTCKRITSAVQDPTAAQITGSGTPSGAVGKEFLRPAQSTYNVAFSGTAGSAASHEGVDYVHNNQTVARVEVIAAAAGKVVYVRNGCPQSSMFTHNNSARECGAGWGNHVVILHEGGFFTRYAHLEPNTITVNAGENVEIGQKLANMGNSGRSETRHLHFELGTKNSPFLSCQMSQNFSYVYNPEGLSYNYTGISELQTDPHLYLYTHADGSVYLNFELLQPTAVRIELLDIVGKAVLSFQTQNYLSGKHTLDLQPINASDTLKGFYVCKLQVNDKVFTKKVFIP